MSISGIYDNNNIFNKILTGQAPCVKVYEDDINFAFMDLFPEADGHTLVIPKLKARNIFDIPLDYLGKYMCAVQLIAHAVNDAFKPDGIRVMQFNGSAATQTVFHVHFHIIPCFEGVKLNEHSLTKANLEKLNENADKIIMSLEKRLR